MLLDIVCVSVPTNTLSLHCKWTVSQVANSQRSLLQDPEQPLITFMGIFDTFSIFLLAPQRDRKTAGGKCRLKALLPLGMEEQCGFSMNRGSQSAL